MVEHCGLSAQAEGQLGVVEEVIFETAADESEVALAEFNVSVGLVGGAEFGMQAGAGVANDPVGDGAAETGELDARGDIIGGVDIVFKAAVGGGQGHLVGRVPEDEGLPDFVAVEGAVVDHGEAAVVSTVEVDSAVVVAEIAVAHLERAFDDYDAGVAIPDVAIPGVADEAAVLDNGLGFDAGDIDGGF